MEYKLDLKLAVLIDADNVPSLNVKGMMEEIAKYGVPTFKRIYGDWTKPNLAGWKNILLENAITPIQQYGYTTGKNSTDSAMIIDAMDILYTGKVDGFCIVSSDSDFTKLATRLRESGMKVFGFGEKKTPNPFIVACDKFIYLEILKGTVFTDSSEAKSSKIANSNKQETVQQINKEIVAIIATTVDDLADEDGWAFLGEVGSLLIKKKPDFDPRNYGFDKLTPLIKSLKEKFDIDERITERASIKLVYIRTKNYSTQQHT
jgi:Fe-S-cluster formation regulator IscX/YfhJ